MELCPPGFYCLAAVPDAQPCPANTVTAAGATALTQCAAAPGFYGTPGNAGLDCPSNHYCPGAGAGAECPPHTAAPPRSAAVGNCSVLGGYYGVPGGTDILLCPAGSFCPPETAYPVPCPPNMDAPAGSDEQGDCEIEPGGCAGRADRPTLRLTLSLGGCCRCVAAAGGGRWGGVRC